MGKERTASGGTADLATPTLKSDLYTTGRGGQGNMAKNDYGSEARAAQDVEAPKGLQREEVKGEPVHYGRGGAANVTKKGEGAEGEKAKEKEKGFLEKMGLKKN